VYNVALSASDVLALYQGALSADVVAPAVTTVTSPTPNGSYGAGSTIALSVSFSEVVTVTGTPQLTLETGANDAVALYASGSGTATVTFAYTVGAGQTAADLDYVSAGALTLNGGTIRDAAGNSASLMLPPPGAPGSLAANKALVVDAAATLQPIMSLDFDAGAGTVAADSSGNGNNGTLLNGPVWTTGVTGRALRFDGSNDEVTVADSASINSVTAQVTVAAWVYRTAAQASWAAVVSRQKGTANQEHYYLGFSNTGQYRWFVNTTSGYSSTALGGTAPVGQWVYVVGTYDGAMVRFYVNGVQQFATARTGTFAPDTTGLLIGAGSNDAAHTPVEAFNGRVDAVQVYNVALTASQVLTLYQGTMP
jgi:hypothetical protein